MSGVEAAAVLGVISSLIAIIDGTKKVYDAASSATGFPTAFREVSTRLPIVKEILESTKQYIDDSRIDASSYSVIKTLIEACEERAKRLKAIFDKVIPGDEDSRLARYISAAKTLGKGERVESLMQGLMKDVLLLVSKHVMELATSQQIAGLTTSIKELSAIDPSLPDAALEDTAFTNNNFGNGPMTNNNVMGNQKYQANYGSGEQYQAETQNFHMKNGPVNEQSFHAPVQQYFSSYPALTEDEVQKECEDGILRQLEFDEMQERYYDIAEAHQKTFEWIYERTEMKFVQWLRGGKGIYWITGKAGSGKSTLMKFIYQNRRTHENIPSDSGNTLVSSFFFHDSGHNPLLKSQEGLFRAILHSVLSKYRQLIPIALPDRFDRMKEDLRCGQHRSSILTWSTHELRLGFKAIVSQSQIRLHLCLLIDGLDEFSGHCQDIVDTLNHLLPTAADSHVRVQMCLSSRPLEVFEESYSRHTHLRVQDLTVDDIKLYVTTKFNNVPRWADLLTEDPTTTALVTNEILDKAQGVFLWVTLVVRSLIDGLRNRDNMATLRRRLSDLPAGLKPLYRRMIEKIDPIYHKDAGRTFNMVRLAARPLSPLALSFSDRESHEALSPQSILSDVQIGLRHLDVTKQLKAQTAGLIEISEVKRDPQRGTDMDTNEAIVQTGVTRLPWKQSQLQYLHLTVKEFLRDGDVPAWLVNEASTSAVNDTHLRIAACCLHQLRVTQSLDLYDYHSLIPDQPCNGDYWRTLYEGIVFMIMFHIRQAEQATNTSSFSYLESLDEILTRSSSHGEGSTGNRMTEQRMRHWTSLRHGDWEEPEEWQSDYISYLVTVGMTHSVIDAFKRGYNPTAKAGRPLLLYATCRIAPGEWGGDPGKNWPEPAIVKELLKWQCDPNQSLGFSDDPGARTVWEALMAHLARHFASNWDPGYSNFSPYIDNILAKDLSDFRFKWLKIVELFLDHGADVTPLLVRYHAESGAYDSSEVATHWLSVLSLYDCLFADFNSPLVNKIRDSMVEKGAIELIVAIPEEMAALYKQGIFDQFSPRPAAEVLALLQRDLADSHGLNGGIPAAVSRFVAFCRKVLTVQLCGWDRRPKTQKRGGCVQS